MVVGEVAEVRPAEVRVVMGVDWTKLLDVKGRYFLVLWVLMFWFLGAIALSTGTIVAIEAILNLQ